MGLIVFVWFFVIFLLTSTFYAFAMRSSFAHSLRLCSLSAFLATLSLAVLLHVLYFFAGVGTAIPTKLYLTFFIFTSSFMVQFALDFPDFQKPKRSILALNISYHTIGLILLFLYVDKMYWNALYGFKIGSTEIFGLSSIRLLVFMYVFVSSIFVLLVFLKKIFSLKNLIFRQQSFLMFISVLVLNVYWIFVYRLFDVFSWAIIIQPLGYVMFVVLALRSCSLETTFDAKQLFFGVLRFLVFNAIPATIVGTISAYVLSNVRSFYYQIGLLALCASIALLLSNFVFYRLRRILGYNREYQEFLFGALQKISYTQGRSETAKEFSAIIEQYLGASSIDIMILSDEGVFETIYSTVDNAYTYDAKNRMFEFILEQNISLISRNSVLVDPKYSENKIDMLSFLNKTFSEIMVFLREGNSIIGLVAIGKKALHADYSIYDMNTLNEIHSYFFLIVYYLKNIAKEDVAITVDKEIEMSDQIIGSIQQNMDMIKDRRIDVSHVCYSAHQLGGDFIDFIRLDDEKYFFVIGDVAGNGLSASMSMVILKSTLRTFLVETRDFKDLIVKINSFIKMNLPRSTFFAGLFAILDMHDNTIYYINCGIPLMSMYVDSYKNVIEIQGEGRVLGVVKNIEQYLKVRKIVLAKNDIILLTTDGLLESSNLREVKFGNDRVNRLLLSLKNDNAKSIASAVYKNLLSFVSSEIEDDITMLVFKRNA